MKAGEVAAPRSHWLAPFEDRRGHAGLGQTQSRPSPRRAGAHNHHAWYGYTDGPRWGRRARRSDGKALAFARHFDPHAIAEPTFLAGIKRAAQDANLANARVRPSQSVRRQGFQRIVQRFERDEDIDYLNHEVRLVSALTLREIGLSCHAQGFLS